MSIKVKTQIKESFIHLRNIRLLVRTDSIQYLEYSRDKTGRIIGIDIFHCDDVNNITNEEDIQTIAAYLDIPVFGEKTEFPYELTT